MLRAAIGFTLALLAASVFRRVRILNILAAVALGFLICDPDQLFEPSFQLSFAAVAAIGALAAPLIDRTSSILREAAGDIDRVRPSSDDRAARFQSSCRITTACGDDLVSDVDRGPGSLLVWSALEVGRLRWRSR